MQRNMQFIGTEGGTETVIRTSERCPVCHFDGSGVLCDEHEVLLHDFDKLRDYINNLERFDKNVVYLLECAIGNRISYVINDIPFVNGNMDIEGYLKEKFNDRLENGKEVKMSLWMETILREILLLRKARSMVLRLMNEGV